MTEAVVAEATPNEAVLNVRQLTKADRCDKCNAEAFILVVMPGGGELTFCMHHGNENKDRLAEVALYVSDQTGLLNIKPSPSASIT